MAREGGGRLGQRGAYAGLAVLADQGERGGPGLRARTGQPVGDLLEVVGQLSQQREAVLVLRHQVDDILELTRVEVTEDAAEVHAGTLVPTGPGCADRRPTAQWRTGGRATRVLASDKRSHMTEVHHGLEGIVAFATEIAEPDKEGSALRYRGVDIEELVGRVPFEKVWGLLIDGTYEPGLPPAEPYNIPIHTGDIRADVQAAVAMLAPMLGMRQTYDISDEQARLDLSRVAVMVLSYAAQAARGLGLPIVPQSEVDHGVTLAEKFMIRWKGEADPKQVKAIDAYWSSAAEHGMNASTFTARVITSTGADVAAAFSGAIGAMSGPLHGGAPSRVLGMIEEVERRGDAAVYVKELLDQGERLMGFGHRVYRAEDPRARVLRRTARELSAPRFEVAEALEKAALEELRSRRPDRVLETNVEFWAAIILDFAEVPANMFTSMFTCARTGGWSAHILEQKRTGRLIRPSAVYTGPASRPASAVKGWDPDWAAS